MVIERYSHVMHIVSGCRQAPAVSPGGSAAAFPQGNRLGAPKRAAMR